jgi:alkenylglycerophosphocholine hydrolase
MNTPPAIVIILYLLSAAAAVYGVEARRPLLPVVTKPLTTLLLLFVVGRPTAPFDWLVVTGIVLSLAGDVVLLRDTNRAFLLGLVLFLGAHLSYIAAFAGVAHWSAPVAIYAVVMAAITALLIRKLWAGAAGLRGPVVVYAAAISTMVVTALATRGGDLPDLAARLAGVGALLFYVSDSSLALNRFYRPIKYASVYTLGIYWLGQLGIALAARLGP